MVRRRLLVGGLLGAALVVTGLGAGERPDRPAARWAPREFDTAWRGFDRRYRCFGLKGVDWDAVRNSLRRHAAAVRSDADLGPS